MKISTKNITDYLNSSNKNFKIFDIDYSQDEEKAIESLQVDINKYFDHYGTIDTLVGLPEYLKEIGSNSNTTVNKIEKIINQLIQKCTTVYKKDYFWLSVRATTPTHEFDIPRWHKDGSNFAGYSGIDISKFVTVLKGPGTLAIKQNKEIDDIYEEMKIKKRKFTRDLYEKAKKAKKVLSFDEEMKINKDAYEKIRKELYIKLKKQKISQPKKSQVLVFHTETTLHSEPKTDVPRLFISIMPESKAFIEGLDSVYNKK